MDLARQVNEDLSRDAPAASEELTAAEVQLGEARKRLDALYEAIEQGNIPFATLAPRIQERQEQVAELEETLELLREREAAAGPLHFDEATVALYVDRLREMLSGVPGHARTRPGPSVRGPTVGVSTAPYEHSRRWNRQRQGQGHRCAGHGRSTEGLPPTGS